MLLLITVEHSFKLSRHVNRQRVGCGHRAVLGSSPASRKERLTPGKSAICDLLLVQISHVTALQIAEIRYAISQIPKKGYFKKSVSLCFLKKAICIVAFSYRFGEKSIPRSSDIVARSEKVGTGYKTSI